MLRIADLVSGCCLMPIRRSLPDLRTLTPVEYLTGIQYHSRIEQLFNSHLKLKHYRGKYDIQIILLHQSDAVLAGYSSAQLFAQCEDLPDTFWYLLVPCFIIKITFNNVHMKIPVSCMT